MDRRSDYLYDLPEELIAQSPAEKRDASRLLVLDRSAEGVEHHEFRDLPGYLRKGDVLVLNDTRVIPARLNGHRPTGGQVEFLLLDPISDAEWVVLAKPAKRLTVGSEVLFEGGRKAVILEEGDEGRRRVRIEPPEGFRDWLEGHGSVPLPPYIHRDADKEDRDRYQTVYARHDGAVAAPTAGLHFTDGMLDSLEQIGVHVVRITLHVGIGTFRPVTVDDVSQHKMDFERYTVSEEAASRINAAKASGGRCIAVGTTSVRTLESVTDEEGHVQAGSGATNLFIRPPYQFKIVDALLTNFHLPGSTLLMLVSALAGRDRILSSYAEAVREQYRFFSYGDAMLIV
ncbi:tRNA preQ1(34) S-adenosylmethionine ribosyltransferase-isomerase QueA [bacterium]|nr:tRNA preQ1(34) S-adenosylmethionine ribosyltransferase-isomerase QueA [bacterium]